MERGAVSPALGQVVEETRVFRGDILSAIVASLGAFTAHDPDPDVVLSTPASAEMTIVYSAFGMRQTRSGPRQLAMPGSRFGLASVRFGSRRRNRGRRRDPTSDWLCVWQRVALTAGLVWNPAQRYSLFLALIWQTARPGLYPMCRPGNPHSIIPAPNPKGWNSTLLFLTPKRMIARGTRRERFAIHPQSKQPQR
jgi:hypothetical protein